MRFGESVFHHLNAVVCPLFRHFAAILYYLLVYIFRKWNWHQTFQQSIYTRKNHIKFSVFNAFLYCFLSLQKINTILFVNKIQLIFILYEFISYEIYFHTKNVRFLFTFMDKTGFETASLTIIGVDVPMSNYLIQILFSFNSYPFSTSLSIFLWFLIRSESFPLNKYEAENDSEIYFSVTHVWLYSTQNCRR